MCITFTKFLSLDVAINFLDSDYDVINLSHTDYDEYLYEEECENEFENEQIKLRKSKDEMSDETLRETLQKVKQCWTKRTHYS